MSGHVRRRNGRWQGRYRGPDGRERTRTFDRKLDAERWLSVEAAALLEDRWIDPKDQKTSVRDFATQWAETKSTRPQSKTAEARKLVAFLDEFGDRPLRAVRKSELRAWVASLEQSPGTIDGYLSAIRAMFRAAVEDRLVSANPAAGIKGPRVEKRRIVPLALDEYEALLEATPDRYRALVALAAGSGLRTGELLGLTEDRLHMLRREVTVDRQLLRAEPRHGLPLRFGPPKSAAGYRTVYLADVTIEALAEHMATHPRGPEGAIFTRPSDGGWMLHQSWRRVWTKTVTASGVEREKLTFHELRHFYASALIHAGCSVKAVQEMLGHSSARETWDTYGHLWPDDPEITRAAIARALNRQNADSGQTTMGIVI